MTVSVTDEYAEALGEVASRLRNAGMAVDEVLPAIAAVTGSAVGSRLAALAEVEGVSSVEPAREIRLSPTDPPLE